MRRKQRKVLHTLGLVHPFVQRSATREEMDEEADCRFGNYGNIQAPAIYNAPDWISRALGKKTLACEEAGKHALIVDF